MSNWKKLFKGKGDDRSEPSYSRPSLDLSINTTNSANTETHIGDNLKTPVDSSEHATFSNSRKTLINSDVDKLANDVANVRIDEETPTLITSNLENTDPVLEKELPRDFHSTSRMKPGLLTVKVYSSKDLEIPVPLRINKQILTKLASLGQHINEDELISKINKLNDSLDDAINTNLSYYLPSTLRINSSTEPNKNVVAQYNLVYAIIEVENSSEKIGSVGNTIANTKFNSVTVFDVTSPMNANLNIQIYIRIPGSLLESNKQEDHLIGSIIVKLSDLNLNNSASQSHPVRLLNHQWLNLKNPYTDEDLIGSLNLTLDFKPLEDGHMLEATMDQPMPNYEP
ncbi:unnamed protein product [Pichia kudriavzevii]